MKKIRIPSKTYGTHYVLVDDEDFEMLSRHKWHLRRGKKDIMAMSHFMQLLTSEKKAAKGLSACPASFSD